MLSNPRLHRLSNSKSKRCFDVAVDHGFFNEAGFLTGMEDMRKVVQLLVEAGPDAIQLTVGQARLLQSITGREKPDVLDRMRRDFAFANHPDRVSADLRDNAIVRMQIANRMIDEAKQRLVKA